MRKLKIVDIKEYLYNLKTEESNIYTFVLEFLDIEEKPKIGDLIYMSEELLNPKYDGYSSSYVFGNLENRYGKENIDIEDIDVIKLEINDKEIYLKRLYG